MSKKNRDKNELHRAIRRLIPKSAYPNRRAWRSAIIRSMAAIRERRQAQDETHD